MVLEGIERATRRLELSVWNPLLGPMHVEIHGDGRAPYLLLVHGICSSRAQWRPNLAALAKVCTPVVVELLGRGCIGEPRMTLTPMPTVSVVSTSLSFEAIRESLAAERWAICGQSFGAGLTLNYALAHPARITAQIFTNSASALGPAPACPGEHVTAEPHRRVRGARARPAAEAMAFYPQPHREAWRRRWRMSWCGDADLILAGRDGANGRRNGSQASPAADRLDEITTPTLLVNGRREKSFQVLRDEAARKIRGLEVVDLEGGHPINLDQPAEFNAAVARVPGAQSVTRPCEVFGLGTRPCDAVRPLAQPLRRDRDQDAVLRRLLRLPRMPRRPRRPPGRGLAANGVGPAGGAMRRLWRRKLSVRRYGSTVK